MAGDAPVERVPKSVPGADRHGETICYRFGMVDRDGPWGFDKVDGAAFGAVMDKLKSFETMTVNELFAVDSQHGKDYSLAALQEANRDACRRLEELKHDDLDHISRLRLGGRKRLYGYRLLNVFYLIWWDPEHEVYPSRKKHT